MINENIINEENKRYMIMNLEEAKEQLSNIIRELEDDPECSDAGLIVSYAHLYDHINTAWNIRHLNLEKQDIISFGSDEDFREWSKFPQDIADWLPL